MNNHDDLAKQIRRNMRAEEAEQAACERRRQERSADPPSPEKGQ